MGKDKAKRLADAAKFNTDHKNMKTGIGMYAAAIQAAEEEKEDNEGETQMTNSIPEFLPTLAAGAHSEGEGQACVMEYVSILAGEKFSDSPSCTDPVLAAAARSVNDWMTDEGRHMLVPLIGRLFGTAERGSDKVGVQLAEFIYNYVHEQIEKNEEQSTDQRLINYMTAVLDKFDELTGFSYEKDGRKLSDAEYKVLADSVKR
jgi:hypothetical protein